MACHFIAAFLPPSWEESESSAGLRMRKGGEGDVTETDISLLHTLSFPADLASLSRG